MSVRLFDNTGCRCFCSKGVCFVYTVNEDCLQVMEKLEEVVLGYLIQIKVLMRLIVASNYSQFINYSAIARKTGRDKHKKQVL